MRRAGIAGTAALAVVILLSACTPASDAGGASTTPPATPSPADGGVVDASDSPLSFAANPRFEGDKLPQIADGLVSDPRWTLSSPDDGTGSWGYTSSDEACTLTLSQVLLPEELTGRTDDLDATRAYLAAVLQEDPQVVEDNAQVHQFAGGDDPTEALLLSSGGQDGSAWFVLLRVFSSVDAAVGVSGQCSAGTDVRTAIATAEGKLGIVAPLAAG
ncbi:MULTISPECIES: hypothetical protein [unclassified Leifsonia]|uniref:hypothetical protein n=1 Tax=unclassified Leifsonia TaxID=2663824 RepID=UPI0006F25470|nr:MULTISPECIES: hypothetical protein [unclassified Leifsonia]KQX04936.1 hypothetical protein ASC59_11845 [Leifsonia sp. Root1293]KRA08568.1 hypothetical protein ASD61_11845 [Leifsonia sp. Root60]